MHAMNTLLAEGTDTAVPLGLGLSTKFADIKDSIIVLIGVLALLLILWFVNKRLAERGVGFAGSIHRALDPKVQAAKVWVWNAPAVFAYMVVWTVTSVISQGQPEALADIFTRLNSTNLYSLASEPFRVLFTSAFIVADYAFGFLFYVLVYVLIAARIEHRVGTARWIMIAAVSHMLGSLLTVTVEKWAISAELAPKALKYTQDVGVSFVMVGSMGAYLWLVTKKWRIPYYLACFVGIGMPMLLSRTIWDLGHFIAFSLGTLMGFLATRRPMRDPILWKDEVAAHPPRALPTFPNELSHFRRP